MDVGELLLTPLVLHLGPSELLLTPFVLHLGLRGDKQVACSGTVLSKAPRRWRHRTRMAEGSSPLHTGRR